MVISKITPFLGFLGDLEVLPPAESGALQVFGLRAPPRRSKVSYRTLDEALAERTLVVNEVTALGVTSLRAMNSGKWPVFLRAGERFPGQRQAWRLRMTLLLGPLETVKLPAERLEPEAGPDGAPGGAAPIAAPRDASGALFAAGGRVLGLELFDRKETLRKSWARVLAARRSPRAGEEAGPAALLRPEDAAAWLQRATGARVEVLPSPGLVLRLSVRGEDLEGECLLLENEPLHVILAAAAPPGASRVSPGLPGDRYVPAAGGLPAAGAERPA